MRRLALATISVLVIGAAHGSPAGAGIDHGFPFNCGDQKRPGAGWYDLEAYNIHCQDARDFAKRFTFNGFKDGPWECRDEPAGYEQTRFSCKRNKVDKGHQHVRFFVGS